MQLPEVERPVPFQEYRDIASAAEIVGFDSLWMGDHLLYRGDGRPERGPLEAWTVLAGLAATTTRVTLGPLVTCTAFRPAWLLAKIAATVDEMSGQRLVLGIGAGWNEQEFEAFGIPFDHRVSRFEESLHALLKLLAGERVSVEGRFVQLRDAVLDPRPARRPPLMVGSMGKRMLEVALPHVDAWNAWYEDYGNSPDGFGELSRSITASARKVGREPSQIKRSACVLVEVEDGAAERNASPSAPALKGSVEGMAAALRALAEAGADEAILVVNPITERSVRSLGDVLALLDQ